MFDEILKNFRDGRLDEAQAQRLIIERFYDRGEESILDLHRQQRLGFPEVVYAAGKDDGQMLETARRLAAAGGCVYLSGVDARRAALLREAFPDWVCDHAGEMMRICRQAPEPGDLGTVGVITAGTADVPWARECMLLLEGLGARVIPVFDAGVAGIHRPFLSLETVREAEVLVVFAGMEGVLPTLLASLTDKPLVAVPTPVGYGVGDRGVGALMTMLQTCVPGVLVVNIGNSVGAAAGAVRVLRALRRGEAGE